MLTNFEKPLRLRRACALKLLPTALISSAYARAAEFDCTGRSLDNVAESRSLQFQLQGLMVDCKRISLPLFVAMALLASIEARGADASAAVTRLTLTATDLDPSDGVPPAFDFTTGGEAYFGFLGVGVSGLYVHSETSPDFLNATMGAEVNEVYSTLSIEMIPGESRIDGHASDKGRFFATSSWQNLRTGGSDPYTLRIAPGTALRVEFDYALSVKTESEPGCLPEDGWPVAPHRCEGGTAAFMFRSADASGPPLFVQQDIYLFGEGDLSENKSGTIVVDLENRTDTDAYRDFGLGLTATGWGAASAVPEPSTYGLLFGGIAALLTYRRSRGCSAIS